MSGCRLWPGHLPNPRVPLKAVRRSEGRLRLHAHLQRPPGFVLRDNDQQTFSRGQTAEPRVAIKSAIPDNLIKMSHPTMP